MGFCYSSLHACFHCCCTIDRARSYWLSPVRNPMHDCCFEKLDTINTTQIDHDVRGVQYYSAGHHHRSATTTFILADHCNAAREPLNILRENRPKERRSLQAFLLAWWHACCWKQPYFSCSLYSLYLTILSAFLQKKTILSARWKCKRIGIN